jgi:hypothetical protein
VKKEYGLGITNCDALRAENAEYNTTETHRKYYDKGEIQIFKVPIWKLKESHHLLRKNKCEV